MIDNLFRLTGSKFHIVGLNEHEFDPFIDLVKKELPSNSHLALVNLNGAGTQDVFALFAEAFQFPDYFGYNWDAFDECINDLDWIEADFYITIISNISCSSLDDKEIDIMFDLLSKTVDEWTHGRNYNSFPTPPTPFHVVFLSEKKRVDDVVRLLKLNKITEFAVENLKDW